MKKSILIAMVALFTYNAAKAGNVPPVPVLTSTPNQTWFYNLEDVVFSSSSSYDTDGYVNYSKFYINGVLKKSISYMGSYSTCFALYGSPAGDCYVLANGVTTVSVKLEVRDNSGEWSSITTVYTIQEHKGRKYFLTDHLGNVRTTVNRDGNVLGYDDYYAFGLSMQGSHSSNTSNPNDTYKFIGEELDDDAGLTLMNLNARTYDPITGRFNQIDPLFDHPNQLGLSPYNYAWNDPVNLNDPTGECPVCWGAGIGFTIELATQIAIDMTLHDATFSEAINNVDWADVATATVTGAATGGISSIKSSVLKTGATVALSVTEDAVKANTGSQTSEYTLDKAVVNATTGLLSSVGGEVADVYSRGSREGRRLEGVARRAEDRAMRAPSANNVSNANSTRRSVNSYNSSRSLRGSTAVRTGGTGILLGTGTINPSNRGYILSPTSMSGGARADNTRVAIPFKLDF